LSVDTPPLEELQDARHYHGPPLGQNLLAHRARAAGAGCRWVSHIVPKSAKSVNERQQDCEETLEVAEEGVVAAFEADGGFGAVAREDTDVVVQVKDAALH